MNDINEVLSNSYTLTVITVKFGYTLLETEKKIQPSGL